MRNADPSATSSTPDVTDSPRRGDERIYIKGYRLVSSPSSEKSASYCERHGMAKVTTRRTFGIHTRRRLAAKAIGAMFIHFIAVSGILLALAADSGQPAARASEDPVATGSAKLSYASFGSVEISIDAPNIKPKADDLFYRIGQENEANALCDGDEASCEPQVRRWRATIARLKGLSGTELLAAVNKAVNRLITYRDDRVAYGKADHWATPTESLTGYGDCEDYAILKYLSLIELGIPQDQMRIVVVKDNNRNIGHAVLTVRLGTGTYVLDNVLTRPTPDSELAHYQPIYSFNTKRQWLNVAVRPRGGQVAARDVDSKPVSVIPPAAPNRAAAALKANSSVE